MIPWSSRRRFHGPPPAWWPKDEPWPPRGPRFLGDRRRDRFVWRSGWYSFWPVWALLWLVVIFSRTRPTTAGSPGGLSVSTGVIVLLVCAVAA